MKACPTGPPTSDTRFRREMTAVQCCIPRSPLGERGGHSELGEGCQPEVSEIRARPEPPAFSRRPPLGLPAGFGVNTGLYDLGKFGAEFELEVFSNVVDARKGKIRLQRAVQADQEILSNPMCHQRMTV